MLTLFDRRWFLLLIATAWLGAAARGAPAEIDENEARRLAAEHFCRLFADKFYFNEVDRKHHPFAKIDGRYFHRAQLKGGVWHLAGDPPAGVFVYATVDAFGRWVQIDRVGFSPE